MVKTFNFASKLYYNRRRGNYYWIQKMRVKDLTKWTKENGGENEYVAVGKTESGCNDDDILSLNDFFEKL